MHLPLAHQAHLAGEFDQENEELSAQLRANSASHSHDDDGSQSQGSKGSGGGVGADGNDGSLTKPPKDLPCPRCQSMNTKFCYYNNYSVNQPRHFCRNCQRYWTVGGTLRNVPVGGGSRKKTRTRSRSDPYYRPGNVNSPAQDHSSDAETEATMHPAMTMESMEAMAAMAAMAGMSAPDMAGLDGSLAGFGEPLPDFPFHPSQFSGLLQLALMQNAGMYPQFMDRPFPVGAPEEEADLQALYEAQSASSGFLNSAAAMMFMPELEPAHLALMHKAALWAEAQRLQAMARRQSQAQAASAWASSASAEERECKPQPASAPVQPRQHAAAEDLRQQAAGMHRRPGFWETALMHSHRPNNKRVPGWSETKPPAATHGSASTVEEEGGNHVSGNYSQSGYDDSSSWGSGLPGGSDLYYQ